MSKDRILPTSKFSTPFYSQLASYEWVGDFVRIREIREQIKALGREKKGVRTAIPSKQGFLERAEKSYAKFHERRMTFLKNLIQRDLIKSKDPFSRIEYGHDGLYRLGPNFSFGDIVDACELVDWPEDAASLAEREQRSEEILDQIAKLEDELLEKTNSYYIVNNAMVTLDAREKFVEFWENKQKGCREKIGPQGFPLVESEPAEQDAYDKLGIIYFVNGKSDLYAAERKLAWF